MSDNKYVPDQLVISSNKYVVRLASTNDDLRAAQSLRYQVFNLELGEGLPESHDSRLDLDKYDSQCDHLLVIERSKDQVVGTYRMQTYGIAQKHHGFYTENEFQLSELSAKILQKSVEVGRACIHEEHRNGRVLYLLWRGLAEYMKFSDCRYLFGCCSITSVRPKEGWIVRDYLSHHGHLHSQINIRTKTGYECPKKERAQHCWKQVKLPKLFRLYIDLGAKVLSGPALDKEFKTIDFLILVDIDNLDERSKTLFLR